MVSTSSATETRHYIYNVQNRLVRVEDGSGLVIAEYSYDPFGRRLSKEVDGTRTYFLYADGGLVAEYDESDNELRAYGYQPDSTWTTNPLWLKEGDEYYWYQNDHLGTPQKLIDSTGTVVWDTQYTAFGQAQIQVETVMNNLRFPGQYYDVETGLHYNYHRYYDPMIGRYTKVDPIGFNGGDENLYAYVWNSPVNWVDSYGLLVIATYDKSNGTLVVSDLDTGEIIIVPAESGGKPFGDPIPDGTYEILDQAENPDFYRLDPVDNNPRNDIHDPTGRSRFRLHGPGATIGCIACKDRDKWNEIKKLLDNTITTTLTDKSVPFWKIWARRIKKYGDLIVVDPPPCDY